MTIRGDVVSIVHVGTAEQLLSALSPSEPRWKPDLRAWTFRGQGSTWPLVPRVLRGAVWRRFLQGDGRCEPRTNDGLRKLAEFTAIAEFMEAADRAGLAIPEDSQHLRSGSLIERFDHDGLWPATRADLRFGPGTTQRSTDTAP